MIATMSRKRTIVFLLLFMMLFNLVNMNAVFATDDDDPKKPPAPSAGDILDVGIGEDGNVKIKGNYGTMEKNGKQIIDRTRTVSGFLMALAIALFVIIFIVLFTKLAATQNIVKRQEIQKQILVAFLAAGATGIVSIIVSVAFNFF